MSSDSGVGTIASARITGILEIPRGDVTERGVGATESSRITGILEIVTGDVTEGGVTAGNVTVVRVVMSMGWNDPSGKRTYTVGPGVLNDCFLTAGLRVFAMPAVFSGS